ncbi:MAG: AmmeMemoRadiSam system protein B, partial [Pirellulales bacterium]|nr:AmmeMemoRadiSam system protein B [Pirellulales bacterium]
KDDPRFPPISPTELGHLDMEVWLLWGMKPVAQRGEARIGAVQIGRHGLQIQRGGARGLLLPAVAVEHNLDAEGFLRQVCLKARLAPDAWKEDDTILQTFEGYAIHGDLASGVESPMPSDSPGGPGPEDVARLIEFSTMNLAALMTGATPNYFLPGVFDGTINGLFLTVATPDEGQSIQTSRLSIKPGVPLQSTLFSLLQAAAGHLRARRIHPGQLPAGAVGLTVLWDPAMHGSTESADLTGLDTRRRAVVVMSQSGWVWMFDPDLSAEELLEQAKARLHSTGKTPGPVLSLAVATNQPRAWSTNVPPPEAPRPPAVAGLFYPGDPAEMEREVDKLLAAPGKPEAWPGAMVPHAGWKYSGRLAANVLRRVKIPRRVLLFSPKHNPAGADWAVAPQQRWRLPGRDVPADPELAKALADSVDGFELDAAAHRPEHAIEVELPLLARLAPEASVVGIAMHGGEWSELEASARQLAAFLKTLPELPLLLISTDMNHFADEATTRRLDRMALDAIHVLDPERLLRTVRENKISMCGVVPAVLVMETLRQLGQLTHCEEVGYSTSAEASGDQSRVVGYAGMLFG